MNNTPLDNARSPSDLISARIAELGDWRGKLLVRVRKLIKEADPDVIEEWKWRGTPVWSHAGIICTGETYKSVVKMTFAKGASLKDPSKLFNASLDGNVRRAIDIHETDVVKAKALKELIREAVAVNVCQKAESRPKAREQEAGTVFYYGVSSGSSGVFFESHSSPNRLDRSRASPFRLDGSNPSPNILDRSTPSGSWLASPLNIASMLLCGDSRLVTLAMS